MDRSQRKFGICFHRVTAGFTIAPTNRADLHLDRFTAQVRHGWEVATAIRRGALRPQTQPDMAALVVTDTEIQAAKASSVLATFWRSRGRVAKSGEIVITAEDVALSVAICTDPWKFKIVTADDITVPAGIEHKPHDIVSIGPVPDPSMTDAEYWHQLASSDDGIEISSIMAPLNMSSLIGGLARMPRRKESHTEAARLYREAYDWAVGGDLKAINYMGAVQVDYARSAYSGPGSNGAAYSMASRSLGILAGAVVDPIILQDAPISEVARKRHGNDGGQARKQVKKELEAGLDILAAHFGLLGKSAGSAIVTGWLFGERLPLIADPTQPIGSEASTPVQNGNIVLDHPSETNAK